MEGETSISKERETFCFFFLKPLIKTLNNYICLAQWNIGAEGGKLQFSAIPKNPADTSVSLIHPFKAPPDFSLIFQPGCV